MAQIRRRLPALTTPVPLQPTASCELDADADGLVDCDEVALGTDPDTADSDADGTGDGEEAACGADPLDAEETCYQCGWYRGDPGTLEATGAAIGDTLENVAMTDQCGELVDLWDFAGEYHVLFLTAAW